jgi:serine/threonine protein phosphatase 1
MAAMRRTFAIGDVHGDLAALERLWAKLPALDAEDTVVFLGDYVDNGPDSRGVMEWLMAAPQETPAKLVVLRGNHEDSWLRVIDGGFPEFVLPRGNGCYETFCSYVGKPVPGDDEVPPPEEAVRLLKGDFFPPAHVELMRAMPHYYEDDHAIYVHGGIPKRAGSFPHPSAVDPPQALLWCRDKDFFRRYRGKLVVFGHTATKYLPPELSAYTPEDPTDLWAGPCCAGIDTLCGKGGFLTAVELPVKQIYESRSPRG